MPKDRRTKDQKRKAKLAKRKQNSNQTVSLAYTGSKYQTDELVPVWMQTEMGIYEAFVMTNRKLCDQTAVKAIESLIRQMRLGTLAPLNSDDEREYRVGREEDLIITNIRRRWNDFFETESEPSQDILIGVLRTILGSIEKVRSPGPRSQSYMRHIEKFLTKDLGVSVEVLSEDEMKQKLGHEENELIEL